MQASGQLVNEPGYRLNINFDEGKFIYERDLEVLNKYICSNLVGLNSNRYWNEQYNNLNKLYIVINWCKNKLLLPAARKEEVICNNELINFLEDKNHKHCCGQV